MRFELPELPYAIGDLEPHLSARTLEFHYERHHRGYLEKLRGLIEGTPHETIELADLVISASGEIFNNAPSGRIEQALVRSFGSFATFQKEFIASGVGLFGSGYVWITFDPEQERVAIEPMKDAESPLLVGRVPLLGMDVWEHAYYLDYQNARQRYVETFLSHLANWRFANENLAMCTPKAGS
jgi:Fe-Mn family superoxide dismutase